MSKKKKNSKSKKKSEKTKNNSHSEGDVIKEKSCKTCHFTARTIVNENGYCKRHREYIRTLIRKQIISLENPVCPLWHADLR